MTSLFSDPYALYSEYPSDGCKLGSIRGPLTGTCGPVPCENPYMVRGKNGVCSLRKCGAGSILNPETGKCVSKNTPAGKLLMQYKRNDLRQLREEREAAFAGSRKQEAELYGRPDPGTTGFMSLFSRNAYDERMAAREAEQKRLREVQEKYQEKLDKRREDMQALLMQRQMDQLNYEKAVRARSRDMAGGW